MVVWRGTAMQDVFWAIGSVACVVGYVVICAVVARNRRNRGNAKKNRVRSWKCPNCGAIYGDKSMLVFYGESRDPAAPHCILVCDGCKYLNRFDRDGNAQFGLGELFDDAARAAIGD